jgi:hypothetical protein
MVGTFKSYRVRAPLAVALLGAALFGGLSASASAAGRHVINVQPADDIKQKWSVYADLYDGKGRKVYHWQETGKKGGKARVLWTYKDGGDNGWVNIWIDGAPGKRSSFLNIPLNKDHCYFIASSFISGVPGEVVEQPSCPFK